MIFESSSSTINSIKIMKSHGMIIYIMVFDVIVLYRLVINGRDLDVQ